MERSFVADVLPIWLQFAAAAVTVVFAGLTWKVYQRIEELQKKQNSISGQLVTESRLNREAPLRPLIVFRWRGSHPRVHHAEMRNVGAGTAYEISAEGLAGRGAITTVLDPGGPVSVNVPAQESDPADPKDLRVVLTYRDVLGNRFRSTCHGGTVLFEPLPMSEGVEVREPG